MTLKQRLTSEMNEALRARESGRLRLSVIRLARAAVQQVEIARGGELDDAGVTEVLAREVKQRQEAIEQIRRAGRPEALERLELEIAVLREFLPVQLTPAELESMARAAIAAAGASSPRDMGRVMGHLMPQVRGRADGAAVQEVVRRLLGD